MIVGVDYVGIVSYHKIITHCVTLLENQITTNTSFLALPSLVTISI